MSTHPLPFLTPEQYLEIERKAEFRSEYYKGEMFAMAGGPRIHNELITNVIAEVASQLRSRGAGSTTRTCVCVSTPTACTHIRT